MSILAWLLGERVPRHVYDDVVKQLADERRRTAKLTRVVVKMKVAGGSIPRAVALGLTPRADDSIDRIIAEHKYGNRPPFAAAMRRFADLELKRGRMKRDEIEDRLRNWANPNFDDDDDDDVIAIRTSA